MSKKEKVTKNVKAV